MSSGFAKVRTRRGGAKKMRVTVAAVDESKKFLTVAEHGAEDKAPYKLYQKDDTDWSRVPVGATLLISGMDKHKDGFAPRFIDYGNRYPKVDQFLHLPAVSVIAVAPKDDDKDGKTYARVRFLNPEGAIQLGSSDMESVKAAVSACLSNSFVPSMPSDRSFIIRWEDKDGKLENFMGSEDLPLNVGVKEETDDKGFRLPNDVNQRINEISEVMQGILAEEFEAGCSKFELIPQCTMFGSRALVDPRSADAAKLANLRFPTSADEWVVSRGVSEQTNRAWTNAGIQPSYVAFKPSYDKDALLAALKAKADEQFANMPGDQAAVQSMKDGFIQSYYVGDNLNSSHAATYLIENNVDPSAFQTGWVVGGAYPEGYPAPIPVTAVHTELHKPEYTPDENNQANQAGADADADSSNNNELGEAERRAIEDASTQAAAGAAMS